jgi:hypothetical protein
VSSRDDSILYSGITSATEKVTPRQEQREQTEQQARKIKLASEVVLEELSKEKANITDLRSFVIDRTSTEQEVNTELIARKLYLGYINSLEAKIKQLVKKPSND